MANIKTGNPVEDILGTSDEEILAEVDDPAKLASEMRALFETTVKEHRAKMDKMRSALEQAREYFEQREDITDRTDDDGSPYPNEEMKLLSEIDEALKGR